MTQTITFDPTKSILVPRRGTKVIYTDADGKGFTGKVNSVLLGCEQVGIKLDCGEFVSCPISRCFDEPFNHSWRYA